MTPDPVMLADLGWRAWLTLGVLVLTLFALIREIATPAQIVLGALVVLLLGGIVTPETALTGFANPAMLSIGALYVVAGAVRKTGALAFLRHAMRPRSARMAPALAQIMLPTSVMSGFLNNTPIVAFLTPLVQRWARRSGMPASKLLIPLSYASILGGMATLVGTSTNLVVSSLLRQHTGRGFAMFELAWVGVPAAVLGFVYFLIGGHRLLPEREDQARETRGPRRAYQFDLKVPGDSPLVGQSVERGGLRSLRDAFLAHIVRGGELIGPVSRDQALQAGDVLTFFGDTRVMDRLLASGHLARVVDPPEDPAEDSGGAPHFPFYEAVVSSESSLVGKTIKASGFRERFQAAVLGIHRRGRRLGGSVGQTPLEPGDLLLIEGRPDFEANWVESGEFYLVAPLERETGPDSRKAKWVLGVLGAIVLSVAFGVLPIVTAAIAGAMVVVVSRSVTPSEARRSVDLSVLVIIASAIGIGRAIEDTGLATLLASRVVGWSVGLGVVGALAAIYVFTNLLTEVLTNSVAAVLAFPVGMAIAAQTAVDPRAAAVTVAIAASASFATPIGYQTNLMVMGPGGYRYRDFTKVGLPLNVGMLALSLWIVPRIWG